MAGTGPVKQSQFVEFPAKVGDSVKPFVHEVQTVKNVAQSFLSCVWFFQGIPRVIRMIPANVEKVIPFFQWTTMLKPYEVFFSTLKDIGNMLDLPEKLAGLRKVKAEWVGDKNNPQNKWKAAYRITSLVFVSIDSLVMIPLKWKLWDVLSIGKWAARIGVTSFGVGAVRDAFTAISSTINVKAEGVNRKQAEAVIKECQKRIDANGPLAKLRAELEKKEPMTPERQRTINELKEEYKKTQFSAPRADLAKQRKDKQELAAKLGRDVDTLGEKIEKAQEELSNLRKKSPQDTKKLVQKDQDIRKIDQEKDKKGEKAARIAVWLDDGASREALRQVVLYKSEKCDVRIANATGIKEKATIIRWFEISKVAVITFTYLIILGAATVLAPHIGLSAVAIGSFLFLGQWITGISTGLCGFGRTMATHRYKTPFALPQSHLLRA
ncbi:MAG: hypothetical protein LLG04_11150 [Parachlamydia sp.]|nr:hypothetical protein [Parachlamydia sp.]